MTKTNGQLICQNLSFTYAGGQKPVLCEVSFAVEAGSFVVICGSSGNGKTTLLRHLKPALTPKGNREGQVLLDGTALEQLSPRDQAQKIGFVGQSPEHQIVTDRVWQELAFGLESLGLDRRQMRLRVAEMVSFFGMEDWMEKEVASLSGGQKQMLNLASVLAMQPDVLVLDEPTSQLDPVAAEQFLAMVARVNRELGMTVVMTEHRLEEVYPLCQQVLVLEEGKLLTQGTAQEVGEALKKQNHKLFLAMPAAMQMYGAVPNDLPCPVTVGQGRRWMASFAKDHAFLPLEEEQVAQGGQVALEAREVFFRYEREKPQVIKGLSFQVKEGTICALLGGNGAGKSTLLQLLCGLEEPQRGEVLLFGTSIKEQKAERLYGKEIGVLPQNPQCLFVKQTVEEDLLEVLEGEKLSLDEKKQRAREMAKLCQIDHCLHQHPYDLSGGEAQRAAFAKVLLQGPKILLLDEPTKGLDAQLKAVFAHILQQLRAGGTTIFLVSHDVAFCAEYADWCGLLFDGSLTMEGTPRQFFSGSSFYTTAANRIARPWIPQAVTVADVVRSCGQPVEKEQILPVILPKMAEEKKETKQPRWKWVAAVALFLVALFLGGKILQGQMPGPEGYSAAQWKELAVGAVFLFVCLLGGLWLLVPAKEDTIQTLRNRRKLPKRTAVSVGVILCLIPLTVLFGSFYLGDRKFYFISLLVLLETLAPFLLLLEGRKPQARELVLLAALCAMGVAGRVLFFFLPQFKPAAAMAILAGVAFGGETGFLVGAATMLLSNFYFGQSAMTPYQMVAMGLVGFFGGVLFRKGLLRRNTVALSVYGFFSTLLIYGGLMNPAVLLVTGQPITKATLALVYGTGLPMDLVHGASTLFFLAVGAKPMLEKLDRIKEKYGLVSLEEEKDERAEQKSLL